MKTVSTLLGVLLWGWISRPEPEDQEPGLYCDLSEHSHRYWAFQVLFQKNRNIVIYWEIFLSQQPEIQLSSL